MKQRGLDIISLGFAVNSNILIIRNPILSFFSKNLSAKMSAEVSSVRPNPYIFDIENRRKRRPRLAHEIGAGAKCKKCGDKCPGFELHFWR